MKSVAVSRSTTRAVSAILVFRLKINKIKKKIELLFFFVQASKKKVYMLYNLQPDRSVTGGAWYSDQDFESEFVEVLNQQCFKFLQSKVRSNASVTPAACLHRPWLTQSRYRTGNVYIFVRSAFGE